MKTKTTTTKMDYPRILTLPPGPKAREVVALDEEWTSPSYMKQYPLVVAGGQGAMVQDVDGNRYLDWMAGIAVNSTGYNHPKVIKAIHEAADKFLHICGSDFYYESMARLCAKLAQIAPGPGKHRVFLTNSGTETTEGAIKLARFHTRRPHIIAFKGAFHGRSYGAMTLTYNRVRTRAGFGPLLPEVSHLPYDNPYRPDDTMAAAKALFERKVSPRDVAAVIMEPIQGEGGYILPRPEFVKAWRKMCDEFGILLIFDEVQSGVGRTGKMWACEHFGVAPDVLLTAKGLASGLPLGAIVAREKVMTWGLPQLSPAAARLVEPVPEEAVAEEDLAAEVSEGVDLEVEGLEAEDSEAFSVALEVLVRSLACRSMSFPRREEMPAIPQILAEARSRE